MFKYLHIKDQVQSLKPRGVFQRLFWGISYRSGKSAGVWVLISVHVALEQVVLVILLPLFTRDGLFCSVSHGGLKGSEQSKMSTLSGVSVNSTSC